MHKPHSKSEIFTMHNISAFVCDCVVPEVQFCHNTRMKRDGRRGFAYIRADYLTAGAQREGAAGWFE